MTFFHDNLDFVFAGITASASIVLLIWAGNRKH